jgi:hypothetical protein
VSVPTKNRLPAMPWADAELDHSKITKAIRAYRMDIFVSAALAANVPQGALSLEEAHLADDIPNRKSRTFGSDYRGRF